MLLAGCATANSVLFTVQGNVQREAGNVEQAILEYDQAIALNPNLAEAYYNRGVAYRLLEEHAKAVADFDRAVALKPDWAEAYRDRGLAHGALGDLEQALDDFDKAIALRPDFVDIESNGPSTPRFAICGLWAISEEAALRVITEAIEQNLDSAEGYFCRAVVNFLADDLEMTIQDLDKALELRPDDIQAILLRVLAYSGTEAMSDPEVLQRMKQDLDRVIELAPNNAEAHLFRGMICCTSAFDFPQAIQDLETYLTLAPDTPAYADMRAQAEQYLANLKSQYAAMLTLSADNLLQRGRLDSAILGFDMALRFDPNHADAYAGRGQA